MAKIIVFTDLHIVPEGERIIGLDPYEKLAKGIDHANRLNADADRIVCTGDLTNWGDPDSYRRLKEILDRSTIPATLLLGNHDNRGEFLSVFDDAKTDQGGFVQSSLDIDGWRLIFLDTLNAPPYDFPEAYSGYLCDDRLSWLDAELAGAPDRVAVFMHHPPHDIGFPGMDAIKLKNGDDFYEVVERHGKVRHIVAGHVHRTISGSHRGIPFSIFKSPCHQMPLDFVNVDPAASVEEPSAYGILLLTPHGVLSHSEDYEISTTEFQSDIAALGVGGLHA